jgi:NADPH-dependent 2,4-dienoyl-CoA reductase/sulfur reductase-like enzyme
LSDGTTINADVVLVGIGIAPNTNYTSQSVAMDRNFVKTDKYLNTSDENIFAAGDIVSYPYFLTGEYINFGHYVNAQQQGAIAALNMLGKRVPYEYVPFFWTRHWDKSLQYTGYGTTWDDVFVQGNLHELKFVAYYFKDNKIVGFAAMNIPNAANVMNEAFRNNKLPRATLIKDGSANIDTIKQSLKQVKMKCNRVECLCEKRRQQQQKL